jgi:hypothetical protein
MEETWRGVAAASNNAIRRMQQQCGKDQEELTGFVLRFASDLPSETLGLALYIHLVLMQAFRNSGAKFRKLKPGTIERTWKENFAFINDLKAAGHGYSHFSLPSGLVTEPAVTQYIIDALTEKDEDDPITLSETEFWHLLHVLKTVTDCMHHVADMRGHVP